MNIRNSSKNVFTKLKEPSYFNVKTLLIINGLAGHDLFFVHISTVIHLCDLLLIK
jgi:hypothetical protein